jgi:hypothetical protein
MDGVDVGSQATRGLGFAHADHSLHFQPVEGIQSDRITHCLGRLGIHVIGEAVARMTEAAVTLRIDGLQGGRERAAPLDSHKLGGDTTHA